MNNIPEYLKTDWQPNIVDPVTGETISEGTRFTSKRANNFEEGIYVNRELHKKIHDEIRKLRVEMEIGNRVPGGNSFFDVGSGEDGDAKGLTPQNQKAYAREVVSGNKIHISDTEGFEEGRSYLLYDDENLEIVIIDWIDEENNIIYLTEDVKNTYKKGATLGSSNIDIDEGFKFSSWTNIVVTGRVV